jgi:steroid delta-isomerase-like uncharacterized protein
MTEQDAAAVARVFFEAWNDRDFDRGAAIIADDGELIEVATDEHYLGSAGLREEYDKWANAFPDGKVEIRDSFSAGERGGVECTFRGTNTGAFTGAAGEIPATGRAVKFDFCTIMQITGGKLTKARHYHDTATIMQQLGLMPEMAGAST